MWIPKRIQLPKADSEERNLSGHINKKNKVLTAGTQKANREMYQLSLFFTGNAF